MTITVSTADPRSCKALALLEGADQWLKIRRKSDGAKFYVIPGSQGHVYWTNCGECSCPDFQHRGVECKHITAVKLHVAKVQAERPVHRSRRDLADGGAAHLAVQRAAGNWPAISAETRAKAAEYTSIFGTDGEG
jgi:predicted nucleic acid-binding Zn finger protein